MLLHLIIIGAVNYRDGLIILAYRRVVREMRTRSRYTNEGAWQLFVYVSIVFVLMSSVSTYLHEAELVHAKVYCRCIDIQNAWWQVEELLASNAIP